MLRAYSRCVADNCGLSGKPRNTPTRNQRSDLNKVMPAQANNKIIIRTPFGPRCLRLSMWSWHSHNGLTTRNATTITSNNQATTRWPRLSRVGEPVWIGRLSMCHVYDTPSQIEQQCIRAICYCKCPVTHVIAVKVGIENGVTNNHRRWIVLVEIRRTAGNRKLCTRDVLGPYGCDLVSACHCSRDCSTLWL